MATPTSKSAASAVKNNPTTGCALGLSIAGSFARESSYPRRHRITWCFAKHPINSVPLLYSAPAKPQVAKIQFSWKGKRGTLFPFHQPFEPVSIRLAEPLFQVPTEEHLQLVKGDGVEVVIEVHVPLVDFAGLVKPSFVYLKSNGNPASKQFADFISNLNK